MRADYVHTHTYDASTGPDTNWLITPDGQYVRKDPRYGQITLVGNGGFINYNGLETRIEYQPSGGTARAGLSYTLAKATSNTSTGLSTGGITNPFDFNEDLGPDNNDRRHNVVFDASYIVPKLDVQFAGLASYRSALPYSVSTSLQLDSDPFSDRPEPRNSRRGAEENNVDVRISKIFRFGGTVHGDGVLGDVQRVQLGQLAALPGQPAVRAVRAAADRRAEAAPAARIPVRFLVRGGQRRGRRQRFNRRNGATENTHQNSRCSVFSVPPFLRVYPFPPSPPLPPTRRECFRCSSVS